MTDVDKYTILQQGGGGDIATLFDLIANGLRRQVGRIGLHTLSIIVIHTNANICANWRHRTSPWNMLTNQTFVKTRLFSTTQKQFEITRINQFDRRRGICWNPSNCHFSYQVFIMSTDLHVMQKYAVLSSILWKTLRIVKGDPKYYQSSTYIGIAQKWVKRSEYFSDLNLFQFAENSIWSAICSICHHRHTPYFNLIPHTHVSDRMET